MVVSMVGISHRVKRIHFPAKIIHVSAGRFKHLFTCKVTDITSGFELHFKPVKKQGDYQNKGCALKVGDVSFAHYLNGNTECTQNQQMTPNKFDYFLQSIQSKLQFMNSSNLHDNQQFFLIEYRITQILLKIHKLNGVNPCFSQYSSQNNNTIGSQL